MGYHNICAGSGDTLQNFVKYGNSQHKVTKTSLLTPTVCQQPNVYLRFWPDKPPGANYCTLGLPSASLGRPTCAIQECNRWPQGACLARALGSGQTKGFCPLLDVFSPSIYWIFRATQNANRWPIINQMFAKSLPLDARVKQYL